MKISFGIKTFAMLLFLNALPVSSQVWNEDLSMRQKQLMKENNVWMVYGWTFQYKNGIQEKKGKKTSFERFDHNGDRSEEVYYDAKGNPSFECSYTYDEKGLLLKRMGAQGGEMIYDKWIYGYSDNGKKIELYSEFRKTKNEKWLISYDGNKNKTEEIYYDVSGTVSAKTEFVYDDNNNLLEKQEVDSYGNVYRKWVYKNYDQGYGVEMTHYISNDQFYASYQLRYDEKGNLKSRITLDKDGNIRELTVYVYQFYQGLHASRTLGSKQ